MISSEGGGTADFLTKNSVQQFVLQREQSIESNHNHTDMIEHIAYCKVPFPLLVTAGSDGQVLIWNPKTFQFINRIDHRDKSQVFLDEKTKSMSKADVARMKSRGANMTSKKVVQSYITSLSILPVTGHICLSTADCCVSVYDSPSLEITGRLSSSTDIPTTIETFAVLDKIRLIDTQYLAVGNAKGKIIVITLDNSFVLASDGPMPKQNNKAIWEEAVKRKYKWKIHKDWVTQIMYISEINRLVSASLDGTVVLSTMDPQPTSRVFNGHDAGVRCFAWSSMSKILCSTATDRSILIWDPFTLQIAHRIENLNSMIVSMYINDKAQRIVFTLQDKQIKAWDSLTYQCMDTSEDPSIQLPRNEISASLWVADMDTLFTAGNRLCAFKKTSLMKESNAGEDDDLCKALYNENFCQVLTVSKSGWVNVYFVGDGSSASSFQITMGFHQQKSTHDRSSHNIIDAIFDRAQRRLIVATTDGNDIQLWNFHSGQCIKVIRPRILHSLAQYPHLFTSEKKSFSITCLYYEHTLHSNHKTNKRMLMFGTDLGVVSVLLELPDEIVEEPAYNFVMPYNGARHNRKALRFPTHDSVNEKQDVTLHVDLNQNQPKLNTNDILWIKESSVNNVLVAYGDGTVAEWNLEKGIKTVKLKPSDAFTGTSFMAFRRKFAILANDAGGNEAAASHTNGPESLGSEKEKGIDDGPTALEQFSAEETSANLSSYPKDNLQVPSDDVITRGKQEKSSNKGCKPSWKKTTAVKMQPKARPNGPKRISTGEKSRTLLVTYGSHYEKQIAGNHRFFKNHSYYHLIYLV